MYANWYSRLHEETWLDGDGVEHQAAEMDPRHARNLLMWIDRHHEGIVQAAANAFRDVWMPRSHTRAYDDVTRSADAKAAAMMRNPRAWLAETPLIRALTEAATPYTARHQQPKPHLRAVPLTADRHPHSI